MNSLQEAVPHPSKFREVHLTIIRSLLSQVSLPTPTTILDPFAGVGKIHKLRDYGYITYGVEIEPEWAAESEFTFVGDSTRLLDLIEIEPGLGDWYDAGVTSPTFGNRLADHHEAKDESVRNTYRHKLGRALADNNSGQMQWGSAYRDFHDRVWSQVAVVTKTMVLHLKDHIRKGEVVPVTQWHLDNLAGHGFEVKTEIRINTRGHGFGENAAVRVAYESMILLLRK